MWKAIGVVVLAGMATACSSLVCGWEQDLAFAVDPIGAVCVLSREGAEIARVTTPGVARITRSPQPVTVVCAQAGYESATLTLQPRVNVHMLGDMVIGGGPNSLTALDQFYDAAHALTLKRSAP